MINYSLYLEINLSGEMVDTCDSKSYIKRYTGSNPVWGKNNIYLY